MCDDDTKAQQTRQAFQCFFAASFCFTNLSFHHIAVIILNLKTKRFHDTSQFYLMNFSFALCL